MSGAETQVEALAEAEPRLRLLPELLMTLLQANDDIEGPAASDPTKAMDYPIVAGIFLDIDFLPFSKLY